ncbi:hypothetical protein [Capnocytophaga bilenii]|uniref:hypothetical protein n=1 Tax=Capnocytophaga bilenii TaxID=2819369 RepID=UPI0028D59619|nr:hypothetical protein [Capnocytophaga bilenii]
MIRNERHALIIVGTSYKLAPAGDKIIEKASIPKCFVKQQWDIMRNHSIERKKSIEQKFKEFFNSNSTENYKDMANKMIEECQEIFKLI